jgi:hypothetical protein
MIDAVADRSWAHFLLASLLAIVLCVLTGIAIAHYPVTYFIGLVGVAGAVIVGWWNRGVLAGALVLLLLNGIPFVNTRLSTVSGTGANVFADIVFAAIVALLTLSALGRTRNLRQDRIANRALVWGALFLGWWGFKIIVESPGVPILPAISYGRDFLYFAVFLPLALFGIRRRSHLIGFAAILIAGVVVFSLGQVGEQVFHTPLNWLIHVEKVRDFEGILRIYAPMNAALIAAFPMALAAMVLAPKPWQRRAIPLAVLTGLANALTFVRAVYVSELVALFVISLIWAIGTGWRPRRIRNTFAVGIAVVVFGVAVAGSGTSSNIGSPSPIQAIVARTELGISNVKGESGSVGYRLQQAHRELEVLGGNAVTGLGFLNPTYHYVPGLRGGSIRDSDLGSLSIVMTMGLVGLLLAYAPLIAALIYLLRRRYGYIQYGGAMYLGVALVGSITLTTISSVSGLLVLGSTLAFYLNWTAASVADSPQFVPTTRRANALPRSPALQAG